MTQRYALVGPDALVADVVLWDGSDGWAPPAHLTPVASDYAGPGWRYEVDGEFTPPPALEPAQDRRITKARFADLFTYDEHAAIALLRWQETQMTAEERTTPGNPLVAVGILFFKLAQPAEFVELDHPDIADGLGVLAMLGVFPTGAQERIAAILANDDPT